MKGSVCSFPRFNLSDRSSVTYRFDAVVTAAIDLPATVDGGVFIKGMDKKYVLWARANTDRSESASASINLAGTFGRVRWDGVSDIVNGPIIELTGSPVFLEPQ